MASKPPNLKPDIGLYQAKYWLRDILVKIPGIQTLSPNALSLLATVPGVLAAYCLFTGCWLGAFLAIAGRMIINTLDGLIAEEFNKKSQLGAYLNRLPGEFTDILIVLALWPHAPFTWALALVVVTGWVQIIGTLPLAAGGATQSVGPCGQTDRLAIIGIGSIIALFGVDIWPVLVPILVIGCVLTLLLRIFRTIRELTALDQSKPG